MELSEAFPRAGSAQQVEELVRGIKGRVFSERGEGGVGEEEVVEMGLVGFGVERGKGEEFEESVSRGLHRKWRRSRRSPFAWAGHFVERFEDGALTKGVKFIGSPCTIPILCISPCTKG